MVEELREVLNVWGETRYALNKNNELANQIIPYQAEFGDPDNLLKRATLPYFYVGWLELLTILSAILGVYRVTIAAAGLGLCVEVVLFLHYACPAHRFFNAYQTLRRLFEAYGCLPSFHRMKELASVRQSATPDSDSLAVLDDLPFVDLGKFLTQLQSERDVVVEQNEILQRNLDRFRTAEQELQSEPMWVQNMILPLMFFAHLNVCKVLFGLRTAVILGCFIVGVLGWSNPGYHWYAFGPTSVNDATYWCGGVIGMIHGFYFIGRGMQLPISPRTCVGKAGEEARAEIRAISAKLKTNPNELIVRGMYPSTPP